MLPHPSATASVPNELVAFTAVGGAGIVVGTAFGYVAAALARDLGHDASYGDWVARGAGLGAIAGVALEAFQRLGVN